MVKSEYGDIQTPPNIDWPNIAKLDPALRIIGRNLHSVLSRSSFAKRRGGSKKNSVLSSLVVRDFLRQIGISAGVRPVIVRHKDPKEGLVSLGLPGDAPNAPGYWHGHLIVDIENGTGFIDTTLFQLAAPLRKGTVPPMIFATYDSQVNGAAGQIDGYNVLRVMTSEDRRYLLAWLDDPSNMGWQDVDDARDAPREKPVEKLLALAHKAGIT